MLATVGKLEVRYGEMEGSSSCDDGQLGWRVYCPGVDQVLAMKFLRRCDAEAAMRAISDFTDWSASEQTLRSVLMARQHELRMRMTQNLAW